MKQLHNCRPAHSFGFRATHQTHARANAGDELRAEYDFRGGVRNIARVDCIDPAPARRNQIQSAGVVNAGHGEGELHLRRYRCSTKSH